MFLDTIYNYRSTEPVWFRFVRGFFAIILMGAIIYYSSIQFHKINRDVTVILKNVKNGREYDKMDYGLNIKMCTGISNEMNIVTREGNLTSTQINNHTSYYQIVNLNYKLSSSPRMSQPSLIITTTLNNLNNYTNRNITYDFDFFLYNISLLNIPNNLLFLSIETFHFTENVDNVDLPVTTFDNYRFDNDFEYLESFISKNKFGRIEPAHFSLYLGQTYFISFNPIIVNDNELYKLELNPQLEQLPIQLASNEIRLYIYPRSNPRVEIRRIYDCFYGATAGIFYLLFGMQKHEPWGLAQKYLFTCMPCRKSLKKKFARKYVSSAGIPLAEKVNKRPEGSSLEERVQILETLLRDYYLDDYYLQKVKEVKFKHKKFTREYEMIRQENENTELNT
ncbi:2957_t:CDS:2 [Rhizophagus irregularis]|nr:2957_t:CDS:2 [Rhizophagus irregularis]